MVAGEGSGSRWRRRGRWKRAATRLCVACFCCKFAAISQGPKIASSQPLFYTTATMLRRSVGLARLSAYGRRFSSQPLAALASSGLHLPQECIGLDASAAALIGLPSLPLPPPSPPPAFPELAAGAAEALAPAAAGATSGASPELIAAALDPTPFKAPASSAAADAPSDDAPMATAADATAADTTTAAPADAAAADSAAALQPFFTPEPVGPLPVGPGPITSASFGPSLPLGPDGSVLHTVPVPVLTSGPDAPTAQMLSEAAALTVRDGGRIFSYPMAGIEYLITGVSHAFITFYCSRASVLETLLGSKETDSHGRTVVEGQPRTAYGMRTHGAASAAGFEALRN